MKVIATILLMWASCIAAAETTAPDSLKVLLAEKRAAAEKRLGKTLKWHRLESPRGIFDWGYSMRQVDVRKPDEVEYMEFLIQFVLNEKDVPTQNMNNPVQADISEMINQLKSKGWKQTE